MLEMYDVGEEVPYDDTCAWCLNEQGLLTREHQQDGVSSHGICKFHADLETLKFGFSRVKPFAERLRRK